MWIYPCRIKSLKSFCQDPERNTEFIRYITVSGAEETSLQRVVHSTALLQCFEILGRFFFSSVWTTMVIYVPFS